MATNKLYAVLTGDIVGSSRIPHEERNFFLSELKDLFTRTAKIFPQIIMAAPFEIYRGDSFQGVLDTPEYALKVALFLRARMKCGLRPGLGKYEMDARIALGIGTVSFLPKDRVTEGDGEAFHLSGPALDTMKGEQFMLIRTPWKEINGEFDVECALLDFLIHRWTPRQAESILCLIRGLTQEQTAAELKVSQPAVRYRLKGAGGWVVDLITRRYEELIKSKVGKEVDHA